MAWFTKKVTVHKHVIPGPTFMGINYDANMSFPRRRESTRLYLYKGRNDKGAIQREKQMKKWRRQWKINLIFEDETI